MAAIHIILVRGKNPVLQFKTLYIAASHRNIYYQIKIKIPPLIFNMHVNKFLIWIENHLPLRKS